MLINFSDLPGFPNLFLDYIYEYGNVKKYYGKNFRDFDRFEEHFKEVTSRQRPWAQELAGIVIGQYGESAVSEKTARNLELLSRPNTVTVFTGQQLGIIGGPLYTFYKIITAIKLAEYLGRKFDDYNFVPVFWLEGDDHDFEEVRFLSTPADDGTPVKISYTDPDITEENRKLIGELRFTEGITTFFAELRNSLRATEFRDPMLDWLQDAYSPGSTFKSAFREVLIKLFDQHGLIVLDPDTPAVKRLLSPVFSKEIRDYRKHTESLISVSAELDELYHAQVKIRPVNLFYHIDGERFAVEPGENTDFRLRRKRVSFTEEELLAKAAGQPEHFSPNVLLRPVCQDFLFPNGFYIAGPGEVCYFAQALQVYQHFALPQPIIYPRASATLLEKNVQGVLDKYELPLQRFYTEPEQVTEEMMHRLSQADIPGAFKQAQAGIHAAIDALKDVVAGIDKTTAEAAERYRGKILGQVEEFRVKTIEAEKRKHETVLRQLQRVTAAVMPGNNLQERELNYSYFANKYGPSITDELFSQLQINKFEHQVIKL